MKNSLLRFDLSYSGSDNSFKYKVSRAMMGVSLRKFIEEIKKVIKVYE